MGEREGENILEATETVAVASAGRDPVDVAEEFVAAALTGEEWETRDNYPSDDRKCWVERGTTAHGNFERFLDASLSDLDGCKVEELLLVARGYRDALVRIKEQQPDTMEMFRRHGIVFDGPLGADPKNWQHVAFSIYTDLCEVDSIACAALTTADCPQSAPSAPDSDGGGV